MRPAGQKYIEFNHSEPPLKTDPAAEFGGSAIKRSVSPWAVWWTLGTKHASPEESPGTNEGCLSCCPGKLIPAMQRQGLGWDSVARGEEGGRRRGRGPRVAATTTDLLNRKFRKETVTGYRERDRVRRREGEKASE